jgi:hypothetical protein
MGGEGATGKQTLRVLCLSVCSYTQMSGVIEWLEMPCADEARKIRPAVADGAGTMPIDYFDRDF